MFSSQVSGESSSMADGSKKLSRLTPPALSLALSNDLALAGRLEAHADLTSRIAISTKTPSLRTRSQRAPDARNDPPTTLNRPVLHSRKDQAENDRTDALWMEMQATLAEVELSAARGTHFFGSEHTLALEELRASQIALAQAWARSEADEAVEDFATTDAGASPEAGPSHGAGEETAGDILLARKRREANDRYFWRVKTGVLDVVGKLDEVALAMGKVEKESREIWNLNEVVDYFHEVLGEWTDSLKV